MNNIKVAVHLNLGRKVVMGSQIIEAMKSIADRYTNDESIIDLDDGKGPKKLVLSGQKSMDLQADLMVGGIDSQDEFAAMPIDPSGEYTGLVIAYREYPGDEYAAEITADEVYSALTQLKEQLREALVG